MSSESEALRAAAHRRALESQRAEKAEEEVRQLRAENERLRRALERHQQGMRNILDFRKLNSAIWGQRDGYGGRYGALTREEIEQVIAEIDDALEVPK